MASEFRNKAERYAFVSKKLRELENKIPLREKYKKGQVQGEAKAEVCAAVTTDYQ